MKSLTRSFLLALAFVLAASVPAPAQAQTFEQSVAAYNRKDYGTAFAGFTKLAEAGNSAAQYNLGVIYDTGDGAPKDL